MEKTKSRRGLWIILTTLVALIIIACVTILYLASLRKPYTLPPPCQQTSNLNVDVTNLGQYNFCVTKGTSLTLTISNYNDKCIIKGSGVNQKVTAKSTFSLPAGTFKLNCGIPNINAQITSQ